MERLGPVLMEAVLPIPPASFINDDETLGPVLMNALLLISPMGLMHGIDGCLAPDTASNYWFK